MPAWYEAEHPRRYLWTLAVVTLAVAWGGVLLALGHRQYALGLSRSFDLALYARSLWGAAHGAPINPIRDQHLLALHSHFVLYALAPLAKLWPAAVVLIVAQAAALAAGGVVLFRIALARLAHPMAAFAVFAAYLLYPIAVNTALFDARPKTLCLPALLLLLDRLDRRDFDWQAGVLFAIAIACREEVGLILFATGALFLFSRDRRRRAAVMMPLGLLAYLAYMLGLRPLLGADMASATAHFGGASPAQLLARLLAADSLRYLAVLLGGLAFLPLGGLRLSGAAAVTVLVNLLSHVPGTDQLTSHYAFLALPPLMLGAVVALERLSARDRRAMGLGAAAMLIAAGVCYRVEGAGPWGARYAAAAFAPSEGSAALARCVADMDEGPALASAPVLALLADRQDVYFTLDGLRPDALRHVVVEQRAIPLFGNSPGYMRYLEGRAKLVRELLRNHGFVIHRGCGNWVWLVRP